MYIDNDKWDVENIKLLGEDAIRKGIALEVYNKNGDLVWSVLKMKSYYQIKD
ncbi:hypothetical protein Q5M85_03010 [Paraclostridium bifermentans]|nr:hypothetical protein [Paraclostridium bifermentans]